MKRLLSELTLVEVCIVIGLIAILVAIVADNQKINRNLVCKAEDGSFKTFFNESGYHYDSRQDFYYSEDRNGKVTVAGTTDDCVLK